MGRLLARRGVCLRTVEASVCTEAEMWMKDMRECERNDDLESVPECPMCVAEVLSAETARNHTGRRPSSLGEWPRHLRALIDLRSAI